MFARVSPPPRAITHCILLARSSPNSLGPCSHKHTHTHTRTLLNFLRTTIAGGLCNECGKASKRDTRDPLTFLRLGARTFTHSPRLLGCLHCCLVGEGEDDDGGASEMLFELFISAHSVIYANRRRSTGGESEGQALHCVCSTTTVRELLQVGLLRLVYTSERFV